MFKKILTSSLLTLVAFGGFFGVSLEQRENTNGNVTIIANIETSTTHAADTATGTTQDAKTKEMLNNLVSTINIALDAVTILVTPAIMLASWLMSPDWTTGDLFGIRPVLHNMWIVVSNITYFIYAILLIVIAIATIFNSEHYGYKAMLPKLALGIILVPLTWWGVQFTISVATYVTAAAVSIPYESVKATGKGDTFWDERIIPQKMLYKDDKTYFGESKKEIGTGAELGSFCKDDPTSCININTFISKAGGMFSPLIIYSFGVFKIQDIKKIDNSTDPVSSIFQIINKGLIGIVMFIVYGLLVIALIFMLLMRAIKLWFYAIFSPLFTIKYVLGDKGFGEADKDGSFKITEFIGLAFVPAVVCIALGFGLVIVTALMSPINQTSNKDNFCNGNTCTITIMGNSANSIVANTVEDKDGKKITNTTVSIGGMSYTWQGSVSSGNGVVGNAKSALSATGNIFGTIIIDIIALVFVWVAFMAGKSVSKFASKTIEPFENMGRKIGELGMSLPKYAPIPGTGGLSMKSMEKIPTSIESSMMKADNDKFEKSSIGKMLHADVNIPDDVAKKISEAIATGDKAKIEEAMKNNQVYLGRERAYNSGVPEAFMKQVKEKGRTFLDQFPTINEDMKKKIMEFKDSTKGGLGDDSYKKEFMGLIQNAFGTIGGTPNNGSNAGKIAERLAPNSETITIKIGGEIFQIKAKPDDKTVNLNDEDIKSLRGKKAGITKEAFKKELLNTMTKEAAENLISRIEKVETKFFE